MKNTTVFVFAALLLNFLGVAEARDLGFRYIDGVCKNAEGKEGLNPSFIGQCGDLRNVILGRFVFDELDLSGTQFTNADLQQSTFKKTLLVDVSFEAANLSGVQLNEAQLKRVNFASAVLKNMNLQGAQIESCDFSATDLSGVDLSYVVFKGSSFKGAQLIGTIFEAADLTSSDLSGANLIDANFSEALLAGAKMHEAKLNQANLTKANLEAADLTKANLKGTVLTDAKTSNKSVFQDAVINKRTLLPFSLDQAKKLGMIYKTGIGKLMIVWDAKTEALSQLVTKIRGAGVEVVYSSLDETQFAGAGLDQTEAVLHLNGRSFGTEMPMAGQQALVNFVRAGGTFIGTAWSGYEIANGRMQTMKDLVLMGYVGGTNQGVTMVASKSNHPILEGLGSSFAISKCTASSGQLTEFSDSPSEALLNYVQGDVTYVGVALRNLGDGKVIDLAITGNYSNSDCLADESLAKLVINALNLD